MITIQEIPIEKVDEFWDIHMKYLVEDEINSEKEDSIRFWKSLGFVENGVDEWDMKVFVRG